MLLLLVEVAHGLEGFPHFCNTVM